MTDAPEPPDHQPRPGPSAPAAVDVAVVGAGLAGLTAAATAARAGATVAVLDGRSPGGRARSVTRDGYVLNEGGHALYRAAGGRAVLDGLGVRVRGSSPNTASYRVVWDGELHRLPVTPAAILASRLLGVRSKRQLAGWFGDLDGIRSAAVDVSLAEWLEAQRARTDLRRYVVTLGRLTTYSADPEALTAGAVLGQLGNGGVDYLDGGWQSLVDGLLDVIERRGGSVVADSPALAVTREGPRWAVETPNGPCVARAVVLAAGGPATAVRLLGDDAADWQARSGPVARAACLDVGGAPGAHEFVLSADEPLYLSLHSAAARLAPPGKALYSVMRYLGPTEPADPAANRAALERHAAVAGLPHPDQRDIDRFLAAPVVAWGSPVPGHTRPTGLELADRGVVVAGDWVGDRLLADAALVSGAAAGTAAAAHALATVPA